MKNKCCDNDGITRHIVIENKPTGSGSGLTPEERELINNLYTRQQIDNFINELNYIINTNNSDINNTINELNNSLTQRINNLNETISHILTIFSQSVDSLQDRVRNNETNINENYIKIGNIEENIRSIHHNILVVEADIGRILTRMYNAEMGIHSLENRMINAENDIRRLLTHVDIIDANINSLESKTNGIENRINALESNFNQSITDLQNQINAISFVLNPATRNSLGGVIINENIDVTSDGTISSFVTNKMNDNKMNFGAGTAEEFNSIPNRDTDTIYFIEEN